MNNCIPSRFVAIVQSELPVCPWTHPVSNNEYHMWSSQGTLLCELGGSLTAISTTDIAPTNDLISLDRAKGGRHVETTHK